MQQWLFYAEEKNYEAAWRQITKDNPFPAIMGRVCYHPCESSCNRAEVDEAVGINAVERFLGDEAIRKGWAFDPPSALTGKRVLVIGAGPSGLSAAYHLRRLGHEVHIREAGPMAGGMMRFGIPKYRLPREVLDAEVQRITDLGVTMEFDRKVEDLEAALAEGFDAIFCAVGAHIGKRAYIPAGESAKILDAVSYLRDVEVDEDKPMLGRKVVVYGGGNTAIDAARTAKRLGAEEAIIVYRRTRDKMPAHDLRGRGGSRRGHHAQVALDHQARRRGQDARREDGPGRERFPATDR
ncbi:MAG: FAD-dependent oxidoreductase [Dermatophilaceae bacterium]